MSTNADTAKTKSEKLIDALALAFQAAIDLAEDEQVGHQVANSISGAAGMIDPNKAAEFRRRVLEINPALTRAKTGRFGTKAPAFIGGSGKKKKSVAAGDKQRTNSAQPEDNPQEVIKESSLTDEQFELGQLVSEYDNSMSLQADMTITMMRDWARKADVNLKGSSSAAAIAARIYEAGKEFYEAATAEN